MNTSVQYDEIGKNYVQKVSPTKEYTRIPTIMAMSGPIAGKDVLDIACGDGYQTRKFMQYHPRSLTGIDISPVMIEMAKKQEESDPLGIKYQVEDALHLGFQEQFDVVTAIYLLDYAKTEEELTQMCRSINMALKPQGIFSTITVSPEKIPLDEFRFGWKTVHLRGKTYFSDGDEIQLVSDPNDGPSVAINCFYWSRQTYETCLKKASFNQIIWYPEMEISNEGQQKYSTDYWKKVKIAYGGIGIRTIKE